MAVAPWTPMGHLQSFQDEMNRLCKQFFQRGTGGEASWGQYTWAPPVDIDETDAALGLTVDLPGVPREAVNIEIHQNPLMRRGARKLEAGVTDERSHRSERAYGPVQRAFVLPPLVDQGHVQARDGDGVLELRLPKSEAAKPRRIAIQG